MGLIVTDEQFNRLINNCHIKQGCWEWHGSNVKGYGRMRVGNKKKEART